MFLYDEKKLSILEAALRLPLLAAMFYVSYQVFPFLLYTLGGLSSIRPGWFLWLMSTSALIMAHFGANACCAHIRHALPRLFARALLLLLALPAGVLLCLFWPLVLIMCFLVYLAFSVMDVIK